MKTTVFTPCIALVVLLVFGLLSPAFGQQTESRSGFDVFYLEIKEFKGTIYESHVAVEYLPWKHFGFGLGFNAFSLDIEADGEDYPQIDFVGELNFKYTGLLLYAKMFF